MAIYLFEMNMELSEEAKKLRNKYQREWKRNHPEKVRQYHKAYWEEKAASYTIADEAKELSRQGWTQRQIAEELGISLGSVNSFLHA